MTQWKSVEQYLRNTNQQKFKKWLDHPFLTLMRSSTKLGKWRSDSFRGEQTHCSMPTQTPKKQPRVAPIPP